MTQNCPYCGSSETKITERFGVALSPVTQEALRGKRRARLPRYEYLIVWALTLRETGGAEVKELADILYPGHATKKLTGIPHRVEQLVCRVRRRIKPLGLSITKKYSGSYFLTEVAS